MRLRLLVTPLDVVCHCFILGWGAPGSANARLALNGPQRLCEASGTPILSRVRKTVYAAITGVTATLIACNGELLAQQAELNAAAIAPRESGNYLGVDRCERCHQAPTQADIDNRVTDFVLLHESKTWMTDIHAQAYLLLDPATSALSKQICDKLDAPDIWKSQQCLSCHSNWLKDEVRPPTYERGVACESCHGPSERWDVPHSRVDWRKKSVAEKEEFGMIDVRDPIKRAEQCFGCHIGNYAEGKVITHEMYAAGHPPLPSIEIESFAQQMPRHWRYLDEKEADSKAATPPFEHFDDFVRENYRYLNLKNGNFNEQVAAHQHRAAAVILGGAIALREYVELIRDLAIAEEERMQDLAIAKNRVQHAWPELATLDCRACHHELERPSWRQEQRAGSIPGRPTTAKWPTTLVRLAISHAANDQTMRDQKLEAFRGKLAAVQSELERTPFGSPSHMKAGCSELLDWLETEVIAPAVAKPFKSGAVTKSFRLLIRIGSEEQHDFDSARQIAWAMRILSCGISNQEVRKAIDDSLEVLAPALRLDLPNSPPHPCAQVKKPDDTRQLTALATELPNTFAAPIQFAPELFRQQMQKLGEALR